MAYTPKAPIGPPPNVSGLFNPSSSDTEQQALAIAQFCFGAPSVKKEKDQLLATTIKYELGIEVHPIIKEMWPYWVSALVVASLLAMTFGFKGIVGMTLGILHGTLIAYKIKMPERKGGHAHETLDTKL